MKQKNVASTAPGATRQVLKADVRRLRLLPNDLPTPIVETFTEAQVEAAMAFCLPR